MSVLKRICFSILLLILLTNGTALAKGPPDNVTVSGPGLPDEIEITDFQILVSMGRFVDFETPIEEPRNLDAGYKITRWYRVGRTTSKAIDTFVYYPNLLGDKGYVFYEGIIDKMFIYGGSPNDGKWFRVTEVGELAMRQVLAEAVGADWAKGNKTTAERITITGPGMTRTIEVTDPVTLQKLSLMRFEDFERPVEPPEDIGPGYTIIRYFRDLRAADYEEPAEHPDALLDPAEEIQFQREQGFRPIDKVYYHPDLAGGPGYVFYEHLNLNILVPYEGNWYRATEVGDAAIRRVLAENDVSLAGGETAVQSWLAEDVNRRTLTFIVAVAGGLLVLAGLFWRARSIETDG